MLIKKPSHAKVLLRHVHPGAALLPGRAELLQLLQEEQEGLHEAAGLLLRAQALQVPAYGDRLQGRHCGGRLRRTANLFGRQ